jgi:hypothetical protein
MTKRQAGIARHVRVRLRRSERWCAAPRERLLPNDTLGRTPAPGFFLALIIAATLLLALVIVPPPRSRLCSRAYRGQSITG